MDAQASSKMKTPLRIKIISMGNSEVGKVTSFLLHYSYHAVQKRYNYISKEWPFKFIKCICYQLQHQDASIMYVFVKTYEQDFLLLLIISIMQIFCFWLLNVDNNCWCNNLKCN